jgi:hypothetical protein
MESTVAAAAKTTSSTKTTAKSAAGTGKSYADEAATLAADTRKLADDMRQQLANLVNRCGELNDLEPAAEDGPAADTVRRIPMSVGDIDRALEGLATVAGELAQKAAR